MVNLKNWVITVCIIIALVAIIMIPVIRLNNKITDRINDIERTELIKSIHQDLVNHQDSIKITDSNDVVE